MTTSIEQLSQNLQQLLIDDANEIGRTSGFIRRERKLTGASFAQSLIFGWQSNPKASLEELCQSAAVSGVQISPQGLQERLNSPQACEFLYQLLTRAMSYIVEASGVRHDLLAQFTGVYIQDSTKIELPSVLSDMWQANKSTEASLKVQTMLDYQAGSLHLKLATGRENDCPLQTIDLPAGSLRLADVGYFKVQVFDALTQQRVYWLSRVPAKVGIWQDDHSVHFAHWLAQQPDTIIDQQIELSAQRLPCRLIALRVPEEIAEQRRKRTHTEARDRTHSQLKQETIALCDWTLLATNLTTDQLSVTDALCLLRTRWQIELLFKLWKQDLSLDEWRSKQPYQILCEVYAKLLMALIQHWMLIVSCWHDPQRSLVKATSVLRKHALHILSHLFNFTALTQCLKTIFPTLTRCRIQNRKTRPATFQLLARSSS